MKALKKWILDIELIGLVIIISVYHYYQALAAHDPFFVAAVIAVFVDLLHYKSIERTVKRGGWWWVGGIFTTCLTFSLQLAFYTNQFTSWPLDAFLFSSIVPFGVALWAVMQGSDERDIWHERYDEQVSNNKKLIEAYETRVKESEAQVNELETAVKSGEATVKEYEAQVNQLEETVKSVKQSQAAYEKIMSAMNPVARDVALQLAYGKTTFSAIAEKHNVSTGYVSGVKAKMNGHKG